MSLGLLVACSAERSVAPAPQPQKSALLQCQWDGQGREACGPKPLLFIDGKVASWEGANDFDPNEIASVEVFKGQVALKMFGDQARHGVVQITTKRAGLKL